MTQVHEITNVKKTLSTDTKFWITVGSQVALGLLGIAVTAAVTVLLAKTLETEIVE